MRSLKFELTGEKFRPAGPVGPLSGLLIHPEYEDAHVSTLTEVSLAVSRIPPSVLSSSESTNSLDGSCGLSEADTLTSVESPSELGALTQGEETNDGG